MGYVWVMNSDAELIVRRPGPIAFYGETSVTNFNLGHLSRDNEGGIGQASPPSLEGAKEPKKLSATSPLTLGVFGGCIASFGLFLELTIFGLGVWLIVYSIYLNQNNEEVKRLFYSAKHRKSKTWQ
jgi:hypothetical protein